MTQRKLGRELQQYDLLRSALRQIPSSNAGKEKTGPLRARLYSFAGARPTITFQRGTAGCIAITAWEEQRSVADSHMTMGRVEALNNAGVGMSAMRRSHVRTMHQQHE